MAAPRGTLTVTLAAAALSACALHGPPVQGPRGASSPANPAAPSAPAPSPPPERPSPAPPVRQFHFGPATTSLVTEAQRQAGGGDYAQAAATLERALRIEPDNPLVWIELGRVHLGEGNAAQADAMGHKALSLATGDPNAQASAWHLIAESLRARGRNADAYEADRRAAGLAPH